MKTRILTLFLALVATAALAADLKPCPIRVEFRKALLGNGYVARFTNKADGTLKFRVIFTNPGLKESKHGDLVLDSGKQKEIGHLEGWTVAPGDIVTIECPGYEKKSVKLAIDQ